MANGYTIRVTADIEYLDGTLAGMVIPAGYSVSEVDVAHAHRTVTWLKRVQRERDFVRAAVTGNRYRIVGRICADRI